MGLSTYVSVKRSLFVPRDLKCDSNFIHLSHVLMNSIQLLAKTLTHEILTAFHCKFYFFTALIISYNETLATYYPYSSLLFKY